MVPRRTGPIAPASAWQAPEEARDCSEASISRIRKETPASRPQQERGPGGVALAARYCAAMSQENVQLVRESFARWNDGGYDFFVRCTAPDIELLSRFGRLTGEPYRGHEGVRDWVADIQQTFERFDLWLDEVRDLGDAVLAIGGIHMRSRGSGIDMEEPLGWVFEFREARVARMRFYAPPADALEAVGLRE
jgi:ketosteroid isomerase-like protein